MYNKKDNMKEEAQTWQKVQNMISSLRKTQSGIVSIIQNSHARKQLGISDSALKTWIRAAKEQEGCVPTRGSRNYSSDEAKEIARLQWELKDTKDTLEILKKPSVSWENDRGCFYCHSRVYCGKTARKLQ